MKVKSLAQLHIISVLLTSIFMTGNTPIITGYIVWSFFLWIFGYPVYYMLGEPGWDES